MIEGYSIFYAFATLIGMVMTFLWSRYWRDGPIVWFFVAMSLVITFISLLAFVTVTFY